AMRDAVAYHGSNDAQIVGVPGDVREQLAHWKSALAVPAKLPRRLEQASRTAFRKRERTLEGQRFAVIAIEQRLGIERIHVRWAAVHEHEDHTPGSRSEVRLLRRRRIGLRRSAVFREGAGKAHQAESTVGMPQQVT